MRDKRKISGFIAIYLQSIIPVCKKCINSDGHFEESFHCMRMEYRRPPADRYRRIADAKKISVNADYTMRAFKFIFSRDPVILFTSMENPGDRLACSMSGSGGVPVLFSALVQRRSGILDTSYVILYPREVYPPQMFRSRSAILI